MNWRTATRTISCSSDHSNTSHLRRAGPMPVLRGTVSHLLTKRSSSPAAEMPTRPLCGGALVGSKAPIPPVRVPTTSTMRRSRSSHQRHHTRTSRTPVEGDRSVTAGLPPGLSDESVGEVHAPAARLDGGSNSPIRFDTKLRRVHQTFHDAGAAFCFVPVGPSKDPPDLDDGDQAQEPRFSGCAR